MAPAAAPPHAEPPCKLCTIRLEELCYQRAFWFRLFRNTLAAGVRLFSFAARIPADDSSARSPLCRRCLRFSKNALKRRSPLFCRLDTVFNPLFNRARDSLLTPAEMERGRELARLAARRDFAPPPLGLSPLGPVALLAKESGHATR